MADDYRPESHPIDWSVLERQLRARPPRHDSEIAWAKLEQALDQSAPPADVRPLPVQPPIRRQRQPSPRIAARTWATRIAAMLVLGGAITLAWQVVRPATDTMAPAAMRTVATGRGPRTTIRLADGTRVELGRDSKLRYAPEFGTRSRDVQLEGEAYFDVAHDERRPFTVHTTRAVVRDLGTEFNVRSYAGEPEEVAVAEGTVALTPSPKGPGGGPSSDAVLLYPGDLGRVDTDGRLTTYRDIDIGAQLAWLEGRLVFVDTPLRDVLPRLARWYGAEIRLGDSLIADRRYTATLKNEALPQLLDLMARSLELRVEHRADTIVLHRRSGVHIRPSSR